MKIYFAASIRGGRQDALLYNQMIAYLNHCHEVLTEHVGDSELTSRGEHALTDSEIRNRDIAWLDASDLMIAETTSPSLGVGYELAYAEQIKKPVIILHRNTGNTLSAMINGTDYFNHIHYYETVEQAVEILKAAGL